jgi:hypothetical protein
MGWPLHLLHSSFSSIYLRRKSSFGNGLRQAIVAEKLPQLLVASRQSLCVAHQTKIKSAFHFIILFRLLACVERPFLLWGVFVPRSKATIF